MKQTAVQWLEVKLDNIGLNSDIIGDYIQQAKELEKQHIMDAWYDGVDKEGIEHGYTYLWHRKDLAEQYYNENYN